MRIQRSLLGVLLGVLVAAFTACGEDPVGPDPDDCPGPLPCDDDPDPGPGPGPNPPPVSGLGDRIFYTSLHSLDEMDLEKITPGDEGSVIVLTEDGVHKGWPSPKGTRLAYVTTATDQPCGDLQLVVVDMPNFTNRRTFAKGSDGTCAVMGRNSSPVWSNETHLGFLALNSLDEFSEDGPTLWEVDLGANEFYMFEDPEGTQIDQLTKVNRLKLSVQFARSIVRSGLTLSAAEIEPEFNYIAADIDGYFVTYSNGEQEMVYHVESGTGNLRKVTQPIDDDIDFRPHDVHNGVGIGVGFGLDRFNNPSFDPQIGSFVAGGAQGAIRPVTSPRGAGQPSWEWPIFCANGNVYATIFGTSVIDEIDLATGAVIDRTTVPNADMVLHLRCGN